MLVDCPCELVIQLPCNKPKGNSSNCHEDGHGDQHGLNVYPEVAGNECLLVKGGGSVLDLVELNGCVHHDSYVVDDKSNDLNGILQTQGIPYEEQLVQVAKHEDGEIRGDSAGLAVDVVGFEVQFTLEPAKDITADVISTVVRVQSISITTYDSNVRATTAWITAMTMNDHVHLVLGMYILGARRTGGGRVVGKPSRS